MTGDGTGAVRFGRLERRGVLLGLSGPRITLVALGVSVAVIGEYAAGAPGLLTSAPLSVLLIAVGTLSVAGRPALSWAVLLTDWITRRTLRVDRHVHDLAQLRAPSTISVPGLRKALPVGVDAGTGAALVTDRAEGTVTVVLAVRSAGFLLEDDNVQSTRVAAWGQLLASFGQRPDVVRVQILHRTGPATGAGVRRWWAEHATDGAELPARLVADLLADAQVTTATVTCLLAVALRTRGSRRDTSNQVGATLAGFGDAVAATGLHIEGWVTPDRWRTLLRQAYDPTALTGDEAEATAADPAAQPENGQLLGPMGLVEEWGHLRTDTAVHATYWIAEWPRSQTSAAFLQPLLLSAGVTRTLTLLAEPQPATAALRDIRRAKVALAADAAQRARIGRIEDESSRAEAEDVHRRERDLIAGHGEAAFTGLITVTAPDPEQLAAACSATEAAAARAMCELRLLVGQQTLAHLAVMVPLARGVR